MNHGLSVIDISGGDGTKKGMSLFCNALKKNIELSRTLTVLNLAANKLDNDGSTALSAFLSSTNALKHLNLANTNANVETILAAATLGCVELEKLNVSHNKCSSKLGPVLRNFIKSCSKLQEFRLKETYIPVNTLRDLIKGILGNRYLTNFNLDLADNRLGTSRASGDNQYLKLIELYIPFNRSARSEHDCRNCS